MPMIIIMADIDFSRYKVLHLNGDSNGAKLTFIFRFHIHGFWGEGDESSDHFSSLKFMNLNVFAVAWFL